MLKGFFTVDLIDENTMLPYCPQLRGVFDNETEEQTDSANEKLLAALKSMRGHGRFTREYNPGAKKDVDIMAVYTYHARYTDNGQIETPLAVETKCDLDTVEADELIALAKELGAK